MAVDFEVNQDIGLTLRSGSEFARLASLSRHQFLERIANEIRAALEAESPFADWCACYLDQRAPDAAFDTDDGFVSYRGFCAELGVTVDDRLSYADFVRQLNAAGISGKRHQSGRIMRQGFSLRLVPIELRPSWIGADLDRFMQEHCSAHGPQVIERAGGRHLWELYRAWSARTGAQYLTIKEFSLAMQRAGFVKHKSNGIKWQGVALLAQYRGESATKGDASCPRAPNAGAGDNSVMAEGFDFSDSRRD